MLLVAGELGKATLVCYLVAWGLGKGYIGMLSGGMGARKGIPWYNMWWHGS